MHAFTPLITAVDDIPTYESARFPKLSFATSPTITFSLERGYKIFKNLGCIFLLLSLSGLKLHESQPVRIRRSRTGKITVLMTNGRIWQKTMALLLSWRCIKHIQPTRFLYTSPLLFVFETVILTASRLRSP